jgi:hypothetical protein
LEAIGVERIWIDTLAMLCWLVWAALSEVVLLESDSGATLGAALACTNDGCSFLQPSSPFHLPVTGCQNGLLHVRNLSSAMQETQATWHARRQLAHGASRMGYLDIIRPEPNLPLPYSSTALAGMHDQIRPLVPSLPFQQ